MSSLVSLNRLFIPFVLLCIAVPAFADGPDDNIPSKVRRIPRLGIELSTAERAGLERRLAEFKAELEHLERHTDRFTHRHIPDVEIFYRAVKTNLEHQEFFSRRDYFNAVEILKVGMQRARDLLKGEAPWDKQTGLVVRGYRSKIDGTVQPYGLVVSENYSPLSAHGYRLDLWFHGRGETLSETNFIAQRMKQRGRYTPRSTIVLHPYGRYSNAFKFAGEVDVLEALEDVQRRYYIDEDRISVRGFSMGGAACWQFAVHYADRWFAANPGAGFSETPEFLKFFQKETLKPTWYQRKLWHWYDCPGYAINLYHCPTIAYSGELDTQKQAADVMEQALRDVGIDLLHIIGPKTKHAIHPASMKEIEQRMYVLAKEGRQRNPKDIKFATYTLKYNRMHWITLNRLEEHWEAAKVGASVVARDRIAIRCQNVRDLTIDMPPGQTLLDIRSPIEITINGTTLTAPRPKSDRSFNVRLRYSFRNNTWRLGPPRYDGLVKKHDLQGPIDDAFTESFVFVRPNGRTRNRSVGFWSRKELQHAITHWRQQFRGDAEVKDPEHITWIDIASKNLVLFGDPQNNSVIAAIAKDLPIKWSGTDIVVGNRRYDASTHALVMIYPNPYNPSKYIVLNSGFTYREYAYLNNARQVPMLPDWAIIDIRTPPGSQHPGRVDDAGFFGERWELKERRRER